MGLSYLRREGEGMGGGGGEVDRIGRGWVVGRGEGEGRRNVSEDDKIIKEK